MYTPKHFAVSDQQELFRFIRENAFGQLISTQQGRPEASHLPFLLSHDGRNLECHLACQNPQLKQLDGQEVLIIFSGPHGYISPRWYSSPGVPTWNYQAVHVYGTAHLFGDEDRLTRMVDTLSEKYESAAAEPWIPEYSSKLLRAIVGVTIEIREIHGKYKLSQNRSLSDRQRIIEALHENGDTVLADAMCSATDDH